MIRPHLEFAVPVWSPFLKSDIEELEKVRKRVLKLPYYGKKMENKDRQQCMGLTKWKIAV
jgi:hypothetical protein